MSAINTSENELAAIRQELNELRQTVAGMRNGNGHYNGNGSSLLEATESTAITDRRGMLKKVAGLAMGVATVGLLRPSSSSGAFKRKPLSPEATGGSIILGTDFSAVTTGQENLRTVIANPSTVLCPVVFMSDNYNNNEFSNPASTFISLVGHVDNSGATPTAGDFIGVYGEARTPDGGNGIGVFAISDNIGVKATGGTGGCGVDAICDGSTSSYAFNGSSDLGRGGSFSGGDTGISVNGGRVTICLIASTEASPPTGSHSLGEIVVVNDYTMWYSIASGSPATFRRLAGPPLTASDLGTAGALSLLTAPLRLVDTRPGSGFFDAGNPFTNDTLRLYSIVGLAAGKVPTGATAIVGRLTVVGATAAGVLQESPNPPGVGNDLGQGTAVLNYPTSSVLSAFGATFVSALNASGQIRVRAFMAGGGSVNVVLDIVGFYL